jgi:hypothetical protein
VTEDGWGVALRCLHCGWERDITRKWGTEGVTTPRAADGERPPPLWETYCIAFPWEDWVRLALSGKARGKEETHDKSRLRLRGP